MESSPVPEAVDAQAAATGSVTVALSVAVALIVIAALLVAQGIYRRRRTAPAPVGGSPWALEEEVPGASSSWFTRGAAHVNGTPSAETPELREEPATDEPATSEPASDEPASDEPASSEPAVETPRDATTTVNPLFRGPGPARGKAGALVAVTQKPYAVIGERDDVAAVLTRLYALTVRGRGTVHVVQLTAAGASDIAAELAVAGAIIGDDPSHRDVTPGRPDPPSPAPPSSASGPALLGLRRPRLDGPAVRVLREARDAVLVVETGSSRASAVEEAVAMLDGLGVDLLGVIVWQGRVPRDPAAGAPR